MALSSYVEQIGTLWHRIGARLCFEDGNGSLFMLVSIMPLLPLIGLTPQTFYDSNLATWV